MKQKNFITSAIILASLFCGSEALAQMGPYTNYRNAKVTHREGQWYRNDYQNDHSINQNAANPGTFDMGQGSSAKERGMIENSMARVRVQKVHEYREDVYINPGKSKTLYAPNNHENTKTSLGYYQRWYNYATDGQIDRNLITFNKASYSYVMSDGVYSGAFLTGQINTANSLWSVNIKAPEDFSSPYYLACDMSDYKDVQPPKNNNSEFDEPTLGQRVIYTIYPASVIKAKINKDTYYETHDIHLPAKRVSGKTPEQVALNMPANNYFTDDEDGDCGELSISLDRNGVSSDLISLNSGSISENERKISFTQSNRNEIPDGSVVYINVTKNGYKIAQFKLTFDANTEGLTETQIRNITKNDDLYFRTNNYLKENYTLLTSLNFDFDDVSNDDANKQAYSSDNQRYEISYYPYPLEWGTSSYAFYGHSNNADYNPDFENTNNHFAQWGQYSITNGDGYSTSTKPEDALLPDSKYHMYIDANQYPGTICELPFSAKFCRSSRLYVTAWIKSVTDSPDAGVLFILKGVNDDGTERVIHTQSSGQITKASNNDWRQIYFEFTSPGYTFDNYVLELFNNCSSANGGDFCVDDIRVYLSPLEVNAHTTKPLCTEEKEAKVQVNINYELLLDRLAIDEVRQQSQEVITEGYYSFVNKTAFDRAIAQGTSFNEAFSASVIHGSNVYMGGGEYYGTIKFSNYFNANNGQDGMANHTGSWGANRRISFEASVGANSTDENYVTLVAGDEYYMVFTKTDISGMTPTEMAAAYEFDDPDCAISGTFEVEGPLIVKINGDVSSTAETVCIGQHPLIDVEMRDGEGGIVEDAVFDWYFGDIHSFQNEKTEPIAELNGDTHSLEEALELFRIFYPDATSVTDATIPAESESANEKLYQEDIDLLERLSEDYSSSGLNAKLTLSASRNLSIRLMAASTYVVLIPVGTEPEYVGGSTQVSICWEPTQILLRAQDGAPLLDVGQKNADYSGAGDYAVKVRLGKLQYDNLNQLAVPVRNPRLNDGTQVGVANVTNDLNVYLNWTDDPRYIDGLVEQGGYSMIVGKVNSFTIQANASANTSRVILSFNKSNPNFQPREGYHYSVAVRFTTPDVQIEDCYGTLVIPLIIVPDYEVWVGKPNGNWNDDGNWRRAEPTDINKVSGYITNAENGTSAGYVPLAATRILIPTDNGVQLYKASELSGAGGILDLETNKGNLSSPTANIEYDLVASRDNNTTQDMYIAGLFKTNQCYRIHFDVRGQMLNSHLLTYDRAWTNVEVPTEQWTTIATPLQGVFTGDWYTKSTGEESAEYFTDLTFGDGNDRLRPYVLQRSWNEHAVINEEGDGTESGHTSSAHTSDVTWSSTYNDVDIQNRPGEGFSILVGKGTQTINDGKVEFRLPKEDTQYDGFNATFQRRQVNTGLLFSDKLKQAEKASVKVRPSHDGNYILVGNPFTASLDMNKFFEENTSLDKVYWTESSDPYTAVESNDQWITSDGSSTPLVPPYTAFYVRQTAPNPAPIDIVFSRDMAVMRLADDAETQNLQGMTLQATSEKGNSTALLRYDAMAENGFVNNEDVQLMTQSTGVTTPLVYTVAGDMAANINQIKDLQKIPLGLFAAENEVTTVTFKGVSALREPTLYDALQNSSTPITEGMTLDINGSSHGRYYIFALGEGDGTTTGIDEITSTEDEVKVTSPIHRQVVVTANSGIEGISIYSANGTLLRRVTPAGDTTCTIDGVASGVAVVMVKTANNNDTFKIIIK